MLTEHLRRCTAKSQMDTFGNLTKVYRRRQDGRVDGAEVEVHAREQQAIFSFLINIANITKNRIPAMAMAKTLCPTCLPCQSPATLVAEAMLKLSSEVQIHETKHRGKHGEPSDIPKEQEIISSKSMYSRHKFKLTRQVPWLVTANIDLRDDLNALLTSFRLLLELIVFPKAFSGGYPKGLSFTDRTYHAAAIDVPGENYLFIIYMNEKPCPFA
ncbi:hypothetical protein SAY86_020234 [Trapa natans]|uniref:Uncharacterized protein n=1 Tax=Trapa natans TaxID=22666 RepID=A0AAN7R5D6_TRANT|nr:hypothetical protein SAY86_020234 [Trapa natans]